MVTAITSALAPDARAEPHFDGRWKQGPLTETFTVQTWLNACGDAPKNGTTGGGEIVNIRLEGDELAIVGGGRVYRTNQCYDPMPTLARESHSREPNGKTWRTRCTTPPNDPRKAILNTLVVATTDTHIDLIETGRYEIVLKEGTCIADVKRERRFDLVPEESPQPAPTSEPAPAPTALPKPSACATPGDPSRLEVRPSKKLLRTGETFPFRAVVLDDKGCATRTPTTWKLPPEAAGKGVSVDANGSVTVAADAPEGVVEIVATAAGKDARVTVEVSSPAHYDELLARSGLNASGENEAAATATLGGSSIGAGEGRVEDRARTRRYVFLGIVGGILVVLGIVAVALLRRSKRAKELEREVEQRHEARVQEALERRKKREAEHAAQQRAHEESIKARESARAQRTAAAATATPAAAPREMTCPTCGRSAAPPTAFCPHDGTKLVDAKSDEAAAVHPAAIARAASPKRGKICPTCGDRFDGGADYCGKDGTQLVLIN